MKYTLEVPDQKQEFIQELLQAFAFVKLTPNPPKPRRKREQDTTEYLLSDPANARELRESIAQARRGEVAHHELLPAE